jgi:hypothetical protein
MTHTISWLEIFWTIPIFVGLCFALHNLYRSMETDNALHLTPGFIENGPRHITIKGHIRTHSIKAAIMLGFLAFGAYEMTLPSMPPQHHNVALFFTVVLLLTAAGIIYDSIAFSHDLNKNIRYYESLENHG